MFKIFMNEPFSSNHELVQARRLVDILSRVYAKSDAHVWLCLNFSVGGKSLKGARARVSSATPGGSALSGWPVERVSAGG